MSTSRSLWSWLSIVAISCFAATQSPAQGPVKKADFKFEELLQFDIRIQPEDPFDPRVEASYKGAWKVRRGEVVRIEMHGKLKDGWNTYPATQRTSKQNADQLTTFTIEKSPGLTPLWPLRETEPKLGFVVGDPYFKFVDKFVWSQDVLIDENAPMGTLTLPVKLDVQICSTNCIWFHPVIPVKIEVSDESPVSTAPEIMERLKQAKPDLTVIPVESKNGGLAKKPEGGAKAEGGAIIAEGLIKNTQAEYSASLDSITKQIGGDGAKRQASADLLSFILTGIFWGAISLITPCVFPMIPITVSFFLKQSEKEHHRPIVMASVYSATIVVVLTLAAAFLLLAFQKLSVNPWMNYFIGGLFIFFALSLFGMYEIELPQSLAQFTSSREGRGGLVGTIFMALTFTIISFACVAPFLGGFGGTAASERPMWHNLLGGLAFAATFAAPFFLLALFPSVLRTLPKSGSWLNAVKVVMGFLELAAAFKFFRKAELVQAAGTPTFFTFDLILGLWIAMSILCGLYLIGLFRLPHDTPEDHVKVPRLLLSIAFLGLALYLTPAMFKVNAAGLPQRPVGTIYSWVDAFLLPDSHGGDSEISNTANLEYAVFQAREEFKKTGAPKRIFIDFTGVTCDNCKINEKSVFTKPEISRLFAPYIFVKMYTDSVPLDYYASDLRSRPNAVARSKEDAKGNSAFSNNAFGSIQLPLYVIVEPQLDGTIRTIGVYDEAKISNETAFADFLKNPEKK